MTETMLRKIIREELIALMPVIPALLAPDDVGAILGFQTTTLASMRSKSQGPKYKKIQGKVMYLATDVADYINRS
jgi:hypothetical protein